jgi:hypothetical protein
MITVPTSGATTPNLKLKAPPLRRMDRADNLRIGDTSEQQVRHMKLLPTMVPEASALTYKHHHLGANASKE